MRKRDDRTPESAYLRHVPPQPDKADVAFWRAHNLDCQRPELFDLWIEAKRMREDWRGVVEVGQMAFKRYRHAKYLSEVGGAYISLGEIALEGSNNIQAITHFREAGKMANTAIWRRETVGNTQELKVVRRTAYFEAMRVAQASFSSPDRGLEVWDICAEAARAGVTSVQTLKNAVDRLLLWAGHVATGRSRFHERTLEKLRQVRSALATSFRQGRH